MNLRSRALGGSALAVVVIGLVLLPVATAAAAPNLSLSATNAVIGGTIHANAQLSESLSPTGEISFEVFGVEDPTCSGPALAPAPASASAPGDGEYASGDFTPASAGTYHWSAHYLGEPDPPTDSVCSAISIVGKASPGSTGSASDGVVGAAIHDEVTITGGFSPGGEVTFSVYAPGDTSCSTALATTSAPIQGEHATSPDFLSPQAGPFRWTATYPGDANNEAASLGCGTANQTSTVSKATPTVSGTATTAVTVGQTITDSATLAGGFSATGELLFRAFGPGNPTCAGSPKYEEAVAVTGNGPFSPAGFAPKPGVYNWTVEYPGDANNEAASSACGAANQASAVGKATPTVSGTATAAVTVGQTITDSATLAGGFSPTGELIFRAYGPGDPTCVGSPKAEVVTVNGDGIYSPAGFAPKPGVYNWTVEYPGDANNEAASSVCGAANQASAVGKATPTVSSTATAAVTVGQTITDSATLAGGFSPTGELIFRAYGPGDPTCVGSPKAEVVTVNGDGIYSPAGFAPKPGVYNWTVEYPGDANNEAASLACGAANQASTVNKALPTLAGAATSAVTVGQTITDSITLAGGFNATGKLVFRAYGPGDPACAGAVKYEKSVTISGDGSYSPAGFAPEPGLYNWTVEYAGDANNEAASLVCGAANQASAVGRVAVTLAASASSGTVGTALEASATIQEGAIPAGQITFKAFPPGDTTCSGTPSFSSVVSVAGNGSYRSAAFAPPRVGIFRWTVAYSGDVNHFPTTAGCGKAASTVAQAIPSIAGAVGKRLTVGTSFRDAATLQGGYAPTGTVTFRIYGPVAGGCAKPVFVDTVAVAGNGTVKSDPFVTQRPGRYSFVASYSGDAANKAAAEPCDSAAQIAQVQKRAPKVKPRARLMGGRLISIRAHLSGGSLPSGVINFRLYRPGDRRCKGKPAFSGGISVDANGNYSLATYLATEAGTYRLSVGYSGDRRNKRYRGSCSGAQPIHVG